MHWGHFFLLYLLAAAPPKKISKNPIHLLFLRNTILKSKILKLYKKNIIITPVVFIDSYIYLTNFHRKHQKTAKNRRFLSVKRRFPSVKSSLQKSPKTPPSPYTANISTHFSYFDKKIVYLNIATYTIIQK